MPQLAREPNLISMLFAGICTKSKHQTFRNGNGLQASVHCSCFTGMPQKVFPLPRETGPANGCFDMLGQIYTVKDTDAVSNQHLQQSSEQTP